MEGRLLAVGDIHGYREKLERLIDKVKPTEKDQVVFLGDLIDRGPDSKGVMEYVLNFCRHFPKTVVLRGNHEDLLLQSLKEPHTLSRYFYGGGWQTFESYGSTSYLNFMPQEHLDFLDSRPVYFQTDDYFFVHAGLRPHVPIEGQSSQDLVWIRHEFLKSDYDWGPVIVTGHTPHLKPVLRKKRIVLDTGVCYPEYGLGSLTCCDVRERHYWQV